MVPQYIWWDASAKPCGVWLTYFDNDLGGYRGCDDGEELFESMAEFPCDSSGSNLHVLRKRLKFWFDAVTIRSRFRQRVRRGILVGKPLT